jgi:hypothetical protein
MRSFLKMKQGIAIVAILLGAPIAQAQTINFEDLTVPAAGYWKGMSPVPKDSGFQSAVGFFVNSWDTSWGGSWSGWGFSNRKDSVSISYATNELASIAAGGNNNSNNYAVAYQSYNPAINRIRLPKDYQMGWVYLTNTTIAYRSMQNGDGFAKKFGGATGNDPDFFKVRFTGWYNGVAKSDTVDFYLADFRDTNNTNDYILKDWTICNLSILGKCDSLTFSLASSDTSAFGMNTPAYFCMDDFTLIFTGIEELTSQVNLSVYPNPFQDQLSIQNKESQPVQVEFLAMNGVRLDNRVIAANETYSFVTSSIPSGTYMVRIKSGDKIYFKKLVK